MPVDLCCGHLSSFKTPNIVVLLALHKPMTAAYCVTCCMRVACLDWQWCCNPDCLANGQQQGDIGVLLYSDLIALLTCMSCQLHCAACVHNGLVFAVLCAGLVLTLYVLFLTVRLSVAICILMPASAQECTDEAFSRQAHTWRMS